MLSAMALSCGLAQAQSVDTDAALDIARQFFASRSSGASHRAPAKVAPVLSYTATTEGTPDFYVFNRGEEVPGFVIISADQTSEDPILGYADASSFEYENIPESMKWWLQQYQTNGTAKVSARAGSTRHSITPFITTKWGQDAPYNNLIPHVPEGKFVTGCTAIAMAQIMKHYSYPTHGKGSKSYTITYDEKDEVNFTADFGSATYDWANMLDDYAGDYNTTQGDAVAKLAYHAGVAERTIFNGDNSSADDRHSAIALIEHFDYDKSMLRAERNFLSDTEWEGIIYEELAAGRPVMYSGQSGSDRNESVGHTFICDGYDASNQTFHINWGWKGNFDGYFRLTGSGAICPNGTGIGGAAAGSSYVYYQAINYNIRPNFNGTPKVQVGLIAGGDLSVDAFGTALKTYTFDRTKSEETFLHYCLNPYNYGVNSVAFEYGVMFRNTTNGKFYISKAGDTDNLATKVVTPGGYYVNEKNEPIVFDHKFPTSDLIEAGRYEVLPAFRPMGQREWEVAAYDRSLTIPIITVIGDYVVPEMPLVPDLVDELCFTEYPYMAKNNIASSSDLTIHMALKNNTGTAIEKGVFYVKVYLTGGTVVYTNSMGVRYGENVVPMPNGFEYTTTCNISKYVENLKKGNVYKVEFYSDAGCTKPMNVPSINYYYGSDEPTVSELTRFIDKAPTQTGASVKLINALADVILRK